MKKIHTEQEKFWAGKFGDQYISRNGGRALLKANVKLFTEVLNGLKGVNSVIEFGSNIGMNLLALKKVLPKAELSAIEINKKAAEQLKKIGGVKIYNTSIFDFEPDYKRDFVFIRGVLIHLNPDKLNQAYDLLYQTSKKYIFISEYYNPTPVAISYRGHANKLFKRDFAGEMLDRFKNLKLLSYGFKYSREDKFNDDMTWFLLNK